MPNYVIGKLTAALNDRGKPVNGSRILLLGIAYKKNVEDNRESPAFEFLERLCGQGAQVDFHDPYVPEIPHTRQHSALAGRRSVPLTRESIANYDAVLIVTDHDGVDYDLVASAAQLVVDTRNVIDSNALPAENLVRA